MMRTLSIGSIEEQAQNENHLSIQESFEPESFR
jgi:hypothetical protein